MNLALLGSFGDQPLAVGWTQETAVAFLGGGEFDLRQAEPGEGARLRAISIFGSIEIRVPHGSQVSMGGASIFGSRKVKAEQGDGPAFQISGWAIFGSIKVE